MKIINIIAALIALSALAETFFNPTKTFDIFSIELNIWLYRVIWLMVLIGTTYDLYKASKKSNSLNQE
jgi:hypothetical protein